MRHTPEDALALQQSASEIRQGLYDAAQQRLAALLASRPAHLGAQLLLGLALWQSGRAEAGLAQLRQAAAHLPGGRLAAGAALEQILAQLLLCLSRVVQARADYAAALRLYAAQGERDPAPVSLRAGRLGEMQAAYQAAARRLPVDAELFFWLGTVQAALGEAVDAEASFRLVVKLEPTAAEAWFELGELCLRRDQLAEAARCFDEVLRSRPDHVRGLNSLGKVCFRQGQTDRAKAFFRQALERQPDFAAAVHNLAFVCYQLEAFGEAEVWQRRALELDPHNDQIWENLGTIYCKLEQFRTAEAAYARAVELGSHPSLLVKSALMLPAIYDSAAEMLAWRERMHRRLDALLAEPVPLDDPSREVRETSFHLQCQEPPWLDLAQKVAAFYRQACPALVWRAPHCDTRKAPGAKLRIGIVSANFKSHSLGKVFGAVVAGLDRSRFEVVLCSDLPPQDALARELAAAADTWLALPAGLYAARELLAAQRFDIVFYPEIGGDLQAQFLAYARLAPLQAVTWGIACSTGLPEIDVFFSSQSLETETSRRFYSEKLIETEHLLACVKPPPYAGQLRSRADFGLPAGPLYGCLQSLFKLHPDLDPLFRQLLEADEDAQLILLQGHKAAWIPKLQARMRRTLGPAAERVRFLPRLSEAEFLQLAGCCDVLLDSWPLSGGTSTYDLLGTGVPLVTLTGPLSKTRLSHAILAQLGVTETVVETPEAYVALAHRLAHDRQARDRLQSKILAQLDRLYDRREGIDEFGERLYQTYFELSDSAKTAPEVRDSGP